MENSKHKVEKDYFFKSYKSFIDYIAFTTEENSDIYNILVLRKNIRDNLSKVTIIVKNYYTGNDTANVFSNNIILNYNEADDLIDDIREDLKNNNYIIYSGINNNTFIQTLQSPKFSLNIKLYNIYEYEKAIKFNNKINCDKARHKVLTKN